LPTSCKDEEVLVREDGVTRISTSLSDDEAATIPCAGVTAWSALIAQGQLKASDTVLLQGTGGVSLFALQIARIHGARVIITSSSDEKLERAHALGASAGVNYRLTPDWGTAVRKLTGNVGVDHVVEVGGAGTFDQSVKALRPGGTLSLIGVLAAPASVNLVPVLMQNIRVQGVVVGSGEMTADLVRAIEVNALKPVIEKTYAFDEVRAAFAYLESGRHFGKICIRIRE
jgi:NADPH:quinone reductase-like Zn-dependent oxidoreductase